MYKPTAKQQIAVTEENNFYWLTVRCTNCDFKGSCAFKKGDLFNIYACPTCSNCTLTK